jgi:hypothetical protein
LSALRLPRGAPARRLGLSPDGLSPDGHPLGTDAVCAMPPAAFSVIGDSLMSDSLHPLQVPVDSSGSISALKSAKRLE